MCFIFGRNQALLDEFNRGDVLGEDDIVVDDQDRCLILLHAVFSKITRAARDVDVHGTADHLACRKDDPLNVFGPVFIVLLSFGVKN